MKLFISWSGPLSAQIAQQLRAWIPVILPAVSPFVSAEDIDKGTRWSGEISRELSECNFGLVCLTRDNLQSQWLAFEAGALSKHLTGKVASILFGLQQSEVQYPIAMFQNVRFNQGEMRQLITSLNNATEPSSKREEAHLDQLFGAFWPDLEKSVKLMLDNAATADGRVPPPPDTNAMVTELLSIARAQASSVFSERHTARLESRLEYISAQLSAMKESARPTSDYRVRSQGLNDLLDLARVLLQDGIPDEEVITILQREAKREFGKLKVKITDKEILIQADGRAVSQRRHMARNVSDATDNADADVGDLNF